MKKTILNLLTAFLIVGTSQTIKAQTDRVLNFDGYNDFVRTNNDAELQLTTGTLEAWVKTTNNPSFRGIVVKQIAFGLFVIDGFFGTYDWVAMNTLLTSSFIGDQTWHHVAMTFQSGVSMGTKLYVDGILKMTTTFSVNAPAGHDITIGTGNTNGDAQFFQGAMDEVRVWNVVRTQSEIQGAMNSELVGNETGLVAYYKFNQGTAGGNNTGLTALTDATSFGNNGTFNNFALTGNSSNFELASSSLPVELISFKATPQYESVKLDWTIGQSDHNKGFQIERLKVQTDEWEVLGFVAADAKNNAYQYMDNSYLADRNVNYYRLRQIDFDGTEFFSRVVAVSFNKGKSLKIYPSIVYDGALNLEMTGRGADTEGSSFAIVNIFGQQMQSGKMTGQAVNVSALPNGTYIVKVGTEQAKFIKQ